MATIDDVGIPGQPLNSPPLTEWQKAVRDALKAAGAWQAYTATIGGVATSSIAARYARVGNTVFVRASVSVSAAPSGDISMSLPVAQVSTTAPLGNARFVKSSSLFGGVIFNTATSVLVRPLVVSASYLVYTPASPTAPFAWAAGDSFHAVFQYEAA